jgi:hypothetical protein
VKADIQQLLKELSGEMQDLQEQLASASQQGPPRPGTSTDPELYGEELPQVPEGQRSLPVQLEADAAKTQKQRAGGGVGEASGQISSEPPQAAPETASLSEHPLEETPVNRQPVPPVYRRVFERVQAEASQPSEKSP